MIKTIELSRIKSLAQLKTLLKRVQRGSDQYLLKQKGEVVAALIPPADLEVIVAKDIETVKQEVRQGEAVRSALFAVMDKVQAKNLEFTEEEVERDITAAREEIRREQA